LNLIELGWNSGYEQHFTPYRERGYSVGRVVKEHRHYFQIAAEGGEVLGEVSGKMRFDALERADLPAVGDWVVLKHQDGRGIIHAVLPRKSKFSRNTAGATSDEQIVAANIDTAFLVMALHQDFNLRRLERYLLLAWDSGATPVIVLSKIDLCENAEEKIMEVQGIAPGVPIHAISALHTQGLQELQPYLGQGHTAALIGSSGVGKSTLINALSGSELQRVNDIRLSDGRGKHTTTHRELIVLPTGGIIIDTPGMREIQLNASDEGLSSAFEDIEQLMEQCRYRDCKHNGEPGCAIKSALAAGELDRSRYDNYLKMERELAYAERRENEKLRRVDKASKKLRK
jgi:ribosome biogenesis GTPase